ncbi:MAG: hypothetical protein PHN19_05800 [Patescibacteria group bacterium]|nr:hypothetical protein [Patescibacteria group bacterium]
MTQNSPKKSQKVTEYLEKNSNKATIIGIFITSFCFVVFGAWIYFVTFLIPKEPTQSEIMLKRLKVDSKQYQEVIESLVKEQKTDTLLPNKNPFK